MKQTASLTDDEVERLFQFVRRTLTGWAERLKTETGTEFPEKVTAFRPDMAVHGKFGKPCPVCGEPVQRIVYAHNEANYCAAARPAAGCSRTGRSRGCSGRTGLERSRNGDPKARLSQLAGISRLHGHGEFRAFPTVDQVQWDRRPGSGLQLAVVALLVRRGGVHYLWATAAGIETAVLHNFWWHECWTWADRRARVAPASLSACSGFTRPTP